MRAWPVGRMVHPAESEGSSVPHYIASGHVMVQTARSSTTEGFLGEEQLPSAVLQHTVAVVVQCRAWRNDRLVFGQVEPCGFVSIC
jgi:hypothetical protein